MTFFDKLFASSKSKFFRCKNECFTCPRESNDFEEKHVRVVVFRECERRGRKLLFDSDAVEMLPANAAGLPDIVEVSSTHAYKYKKPSKDVASMGEMMFGTVAMSSKVRTSSKIHIIPTPPGLLFTTVVPCNARCHPHKPGSRRSSTPKPEPQTGCASDSAMYKVASSLTRTSGYASLRTLSSSACYDEVTSGGSLQVPVCCDSRLSVNSSGYYFPSRRTSDAPSIGSCSSLGDGKSANCSGGSLTSLRRRWTQSLAVSLDGSSCDEGDDLLRVRTKLGVCLVLNLSGPNQTDIEKFLLSNSRSMDEVLTRLQTDVEEAYVRLDGFVDKCVKGTRAAASSVVCLVNSRGQHVPRWISPNTGTCASPCSLGQDGLPRWLRPNQCSLNTQLNFVSAFAAVLQQFDTKTTNFFVSTLLSALLTHNLGWVSDLLRRKHSTTPEEIELCNSYTRSAKVVITDSQARPSLDTLIDVLSYFIRDCPVIEHTVKADFNEIVNPNAEKSKETQENCQINGIFAKKIENKNVSDSFFSVDEGFAQENNVEARLKWKAVAKLVMASRKKEKKSEIKILQSFDEVDSAQNTWSGDENFDSGVDCELREVVAFGLTDKTEPAICNEVLVGASCLKSAERTKNYVFGTNLLERGSFQIEKEKLAKQTESFSCGVQKEKTECETRTSLGLKKTVSNFNLSQFMNKSLLGDNLTPVSETSVDEVDSSRWSHGEEACEWKTEKVVWTLGDEPENRVENDAGCQKQENLRNFTLCDKTDVSILSHPKGGFAEKLTMSKNVKDCCNSLQSTCQNLGKSGIASELIYPILPSINEKFMPVTTNPRPCNKSEVQNAPLKNFIGTADQNSSSGLFSQTSFSCSNSTKTDPVETTKNNSEGASTINLPSKPSTFSSHPKKTENQEESSKVTLSSDSCKFPQDFLPNEPTCLFLPNKTETQEEPTKRPLSSTSNHPQDLIAKKPGCLYPDLTELALMENVCLPPPDYTLFVDDILKQVERDRLVSTDGGCQGLDMAAKTSQEETHKIVISKSSAIEMEPEVPRSRRKLPLVAGLKMLQVRTKTIENVSTECLWDPPPPTVEQKLRDLFETVPMPVVEKPICSRVIGPSSHIGAVTAQLQPHQVLQGISTSADDVTPLLLRDLAATSRVSMTSQITEPVAILADVDSWCVWIHGTNRTGLGAPRAVRASPSPAVADMLESFAHLHRIGMSSIKCKSHLERKLEEILSSSQVLAEFLLCHDFSSVGLLTKHLNLQVNDIPLLLSVATVHTPEIAEMYGVTIS